jgi:hypothetical protein
MRSGKWLAALGALSLTAGCAGGGLGGGPGLFRYYSLVTPGSGGRRPGLHGRHADDPLEQGAARAPTTSPARRIGP